MRAASFDQGQSAVMNFGFSGSPQAAVNIIALCEVFKLACKHDDDDDDRPIASALLTEHTSYAYIKLANEKWALLSNKFLLVRNFFSLTAQFNFFGKFLT
jgi:hypothetical protein